MLNWLRPKTINTASSFFPTANGVQLVPDADPSEVPDYMEVSDMAPHIFAFRMTGPAITVRIFKLHPDGHETAQAPQTFVVAPQ